MIHVIRRHRKESDILLRVKSRTQNANFYENDYYEIHCFNPENVLEEAMEENVYFHPRKPFESWLPDVKYITPDDRGDGKEPAFELYFRGALRSDCLEQYKKGMDLAARTVAEVDEMYDEITSFTE